MVLCTSVVQEKIIETDITFYSFPGDTGLTYNPGSGGGIDGIGIGDDEISKGEILYLEFLTNLKLSKIYTTDIFYGDNPKYQEQGQYNLFGGSSWTDWSPFEAPTGSLTIRQPTVNLKLR